MSSSRNAAGLTAAESKKLSQRQPTEAEKGIIKHLNELYKCILLLSFGRLMAQY